MHQCAPHSRRLRMSRIPRPPSLAVQRQSTAPPSAVQRRLEDKLKDGPCFSSKASGETTACSLAPQVVRSLKEQTNRHEAGQPDSACKQSQTTIVSACTDLIVYVRGQGEVDVAFAAVDKLQARTLQLHQHAGKVIWICHLCMRCWDKSQQGSTAAAGLSGFLQRRSKACRLARRLCLMSLLNDDSMTAKQGLRYY